ncbi:MAG: ATP12 family protein [Limibacillus sp.]|jgi:chaperone required for assembly of F1-ATPase
MTDETLEKKLREARRKPKRFYKTATAGETPDGWVVLLDGRALRSPMKQPVILPSAALAEALAEEWDAQSEEIDAAAMPLTALACTALDRAGPQRRDLEAQLLAYGGNDLLCYWAEHPENLIERQRAVWQPVLDWCKDRYGAEMNVVAGILPCEQPPESREALARAVADLDAFRLAALSTAVGVSGSLLIALALVEGHLDAEAAFEAAELDASHQIELWGEDFEASVRREAVMRDLRAVAQFLHLLK